MDHVINAIAYLNWERNLAGFLGMFHWQVKELVKKGIIKPGMSYESAKQAVKEWEKNK